MSRVKVQSNGTLEGTTVLLDDRDISEIVRGVQFELHVDKPPRVLIEVLNAEIEIEHPDGTCIFACLDDKCPLNLGKKPRG